LILEFDPSTGALPPGDHRATLEEIERRLGFNTCRQWLLEWLHGSRGFLRGGSYEGMIRQLEDELREYDQLLAGDSHSRTSSVSIRSPPFIPRIRIARGISQTELARQLGVSKQVISHYEEKEYQTVAMARLQEILDALGIKALVTLSA